ncbi:CD97 antigen isoform X1 [Nannospalax galili]|uniref:CD97 antigen isoform X1 n=1 Tax=Nannospalax galili TaxID=1026970 RepID=UPI0004ED0830|nr:CD97 antigen isoform X1 [Nannospalax galili]
MGGARRHLALVLCTLLSLPEAGPQETKSCHKWCPANSECVSISTCRCKPGFTPSKMLITDPTETCEDINECLLPMAAICGKYATCENTEGSYYCMCNPGYELKSGAKKFTNQSENTCQDVNECTSGQNPCHKSTHCINKLGGYSCICRPGWKPIPGSPNGPNTTKCEDVDECSTRQHQCHSSTVCSNSAGSYKCHCRPGWEPVPGSSSGPKNTTCRELLFPTWAPPMGVNSQSFSCFSVEVQNLLRDFNPDNANTTIQKLIEALDKLLEAPGDIETLTLMARHQLATQLLLNLEQTLRTLAQSLPKGLFIYTSPSNTELSLIKEQENTGITTVGHNQASMELNWTVAAGAKSSGNGYAVAGILSSPNMQKLLANASLNLDKRQVALEEFYDSPVRDVSLKLLSNVSSVFMTNTDTKKLASNVTFTFSYSRESIGPRQELICAFWQGQSNGSGRWATEGCSIQSPNGTECTCNHLSSFAILMAHYHVQDPRLELITKVGLLLSLICLLLCILTFLLVRPIQSSRTTVHLHLCICLFLGSVIFLVGIENEGGEVSPRCRLVAALLHYCFLAAFCWMSLEGLELYFLVVRVFQGQGLSTRWRCLIGYGTPLLIVAISAASNIQGYGRPTYCWLDHRSGFLWSFVGPLAFIILCNAIIFVITVWKLTKKFSDINPDMKKLKKVRVLTITAIAQLFVLGCTWVFGLFLFNPHSTWLSYIFTLLTCLQGFFLYLMLCLLNKKVREEYRKWACMVAGNKYSEFNSSTGTGTSQNQTRVLRPPESGM